MGSKRAIAAALGLWVPLAVAIFMPASAQETSDDPPSRVARLAYAQGSVSFQPAGTEDWVTATLNRPLTTADKIWADSDGRAEMQLDASLIRLSANTGMSFLNLSDNVTQLQLSTGTLLVRVRRLGPNETYEIDTPNLAFTIEQTGIYRVTVNEAGDGTTIRVRSGQGQVTGGGTSYTVNANEYDSFSGTDQLIANAQYDPGDDQFDAWSSSRDSRWEHSASARYVSPDVVGYEDLDEHGSWRATPGYGNVWFPRTTEAGWAPYHSGHWAYIAPWGYTWVDDQPWGFAPFHYGRWVSSGGAWGWVPSPPQVPGAVYVRPVYAPALVAWVGVGASVAWFPLAPREVYVPSYPVSRNYVNNINISNTTVNTTVVNNYYNTTVVNKTVNVTNIKYVNQKVAGAVTATTAQAFSTAQPVMRNQVKIDQGALATAQVRVVTPAVLPAKQAVLGSGRVAAAKPPQSVQARIVVAKVVPPVAPPSFERHQEAIKNNGGKPLSVVQVRKLQPAATPTTAVRIAPAAKPAVAQKPGVVPAQRPGVVNHPPASAMPPAKNADQPLDRPPTSASATAEVKKPATGTAHPHAALPPANTETSTSTKTPIEKQQEQAQLRAKQDQDRQQAQRQQEQKRQQATPQATQQKADEAKKQQQVQQHYQEQEQLRAKQAQEKQDAERKQALERQQATQQKADEAKRQQQAQQHQQEQEQLRTKQAQEKQDAERKQALERQQATQQRADEAKKQQLEQQHQQQAEQLKQKHAQEQQDLQKKQQAEKQQQASKGAPKTGQEDRTSKPPQ